MSNIFGSDILLNNDLCPLIANNGELILSNEIETVLQDIKLRLITLKGSLFYDSSFGSELPNFIKDDEADVAQIEAEVIRTVESDPRIEIYSTNVSIKKDRSLLSLSIDFKLLEDETPYNLTIPNLFDQVEW